MVLPPSQGYNQGTSHGYNYGPQYGANQFERLGIEPQHFEPPSSFDHRNKFDCIISFHYMREMGLQMTVIPEGSHPSQHPIGNSPGPSIHGGQHWGFHKPNQGTKRLEGLREEQKGTNGNDPKSKKL